MHPYSNNMLTKKQDSDYSAVFILFYPKAALLCNITFGETHLCLEAKKKSLQIDFPPMWKTRQENPPAGFFVAETNAPFLDQGVRLIATPGCCREAEETHQGLVDGAEILLSIWKLFILQGRNMCTQARLREQKVHSNQRIFSVL